MQCKSIQDINHYFYWSVHTDNCLVNQIGYTYTHAPYDLQQYVSTSGVAGDLGGQKRTEVHSRPTQCQGLEYKIHQPHCAIPLTSLPEVQEVVKYLIPLKPKLHLLENHMGLRFAMKGEQGAVHSSTVNVIEHHRNQQHDDVQRLCCVVKEHLTKSFPEMLLHYHLQSIGSWSELPAMAWTSLASQAYFSPCCACA